MDVNWQVFDFRGGAELFYSWCSVSWKSHQISRWFCPFFVSQSPFDSLPPIGLLSAPHAGCQ